MKETMTAVSGKVARIRGLVARAANADDDDDRTDARRRLNELASQWRGYPGQRRRGEPPAGVNLR